MKSATSRNLIPARFLAIMLHLLVTSLLLQARGPIIAVALDMDATATQRLTDYEAKNTAFVALLALSFVCFMLELTGLAVSVTVNQVRSIYIERICYMHRRYCLSRHLTECTGAAV
jgi:Transmembrane protein